MSTLNSPTLDSCSSRTMSIPMASLSMERFSSSASHGVKSFASCFQMERRSSIFSNLPSCFIYIQQLVLESYLEILCLYETGHHRIGQYINYSVFHITRIKNYDYMSSSITSSDVSVIGFMVISI